MIDHIKVRQLLRTQLLTIGTLPAADKRSWENRAFTRPASDPANPVLWVEEHYLKGTERLKGWGVSELAAVIQWSVHYPAGAGTEAAETLAQAIRDAFKPATSLQGDSQQVSIVRSECGTGRTDGVWYTVPVPVTFRAQAPK